MYLNTFHRTIFSINVLVKSYREKIVLKPLQLEFRSLQIMLTLCNDGRNNVAYIQQNLSVSGKISNCKVVSGSLDIYNLTCVLLYY